MKTVAHGPRYHPDEHVHVFVWVSSDQMPGFLLLRCACSEVRATKRLSR